MGRTEEVSTNLQTRTRDDYDLSLTDHGIGMLSREGAAEAFSQLKPLVLSKNVLRAREGIESGGWG
jgi:hypothetical protein